MGIVKCTNKAQHGTIANESCDVYVYLDSATPLPVAWDMFDRDAAMKIDYLSVCRTYSWQPVTGTITANWAYWFARHAIGDEWPEAEELIRSDTDCAHRYESFLRTMGAIGVIGWTTGKSKIDNSVYDAVAAVRRCEHPATGAAPRRSFEGVPGYPSKPRPSIRNLERIADDIAAKRSQARPGLDYGEDEDSIV